MTCPSQGKVAYIGETFMAMVACGGAHTLLTVCVVIMMLIVVVVVVVDGHDDKHH